MGGMGGLAGHRGAAHRFAIPGEVLSRVGLELRLASGRAEEVALALVFGAMLRGRGIDRHSADHVESSRTSRGPRLVRQDPQRHQAPTLLTRSPQVSISLPK
jgi:hypothetical protein